MTIGNILRLALCAGVVTFGLPAGAQSFAQLNADRAVKPVAATGGLIISNGAIFSGAHFTVKHKSTGSYTITFTKGLFATVPMFSCTPYGSASPTPTCVNTSIQWKSAHAETTTTFLLLDPSGNFINTNFEFTAIAIQDNVSH